MRKKLKNLYTLPKGLFRFFPSLYFLSKRGKRTLQALPIELFRLLQKLYPMGHEEYLIYGGISTAFFPLVVYPICIEGDKMAIGLHLDEEGSTFYLFTQPFPHETRDNTSILLELKGGRMKGIVGKKSFVNELVPYQTVRSICVQNDHALALSIVLRYVSRLKRSGWYYLTPEVPKEKIEKFKPFKKEEFRGFVYQPDYAHEGTTTGRIII